MGNVLRVPVMQKANSGAQAMSAPVLEATTWLIPGVILGQALQVRMHDHRALLSEVVEEQLRSAGWVPCQFRYFGHRVFVQLI